MPVPPFRLDLTTWALRRRRENEVDRWDGQSYSRVLSLDNQPIEVAVRQSESMERARLHVTLSADHITPTKKTAAKALLERMLGLRIDLRPFYKLAARERKIALLVEEFRGLKPPRFPSVFEALVNGIACQQLSLTVGILLLNRLTQSFGSSACREGLRAFPAPAAVARAKAAFLRELGFNTNKAKELIELSVAVRKGRIDLERFANVDNETAQRDLMTMHGVGRWTAEYVLLRGLGRLDIFPGDDVGARKNLAAFLGVTQPLSYEIVRRLLARWQPYAGFMYFQLLLTNVKKAGWLHSESVAQSARSAFPQ